MDPGRIRKRHRGSVGRGRPGLALVLAATLPAAHPGPAPGRPAVGIAVERLEPGRWRVTYSFDERLALLRFQRTAGFYREDVWTIATPGYRFARREDDQVIERAPGAPGRRELVVEFGEYTEPLPREYELFVPFADGGLAFYTGHLYGRSETAEESGPMVRDLDIRPPAGTRAVVGGRVYGAPFRWSDSIGDGTYVYIGDTAPLESDDMIAIVDRGLPEWLRTQFQTWLPRLFALYTERFGVELPWKPVVLYGFEDSDRPGFSSGGGTLTGLVQLTVSGTAWKEPSPEAEELALGLLAHEAAHLWNGQLVGSVEGREPWMHEGSADALSARLLREFEVIDAQRLRERNESAINACLERVEGTSVNASGEPRVPYDCGQLMALWTEAALRHAGAGEDLFGLWRALIAAALERGSPGPGSRGRYDQALYLRVLGDMGVPDAVRGRMTAFLDDPGVDHAALAVAGLGAEGLRLEPSDDPPPEYGAELARRAMVHLMSEACDGRYSFDSGPALRTYAIDGCAPFAKPLEVHYIAGARVDGEGVALFDRVAELCRRGEPVSLGDADGGTIAAVSCERAPASRRPWLGIRPEAGD